MSDPVTRLNTAQTKFPVPRSLAPGLVRTALRVWLPALLPLLYGACAGADDVQLSDPAQAVADARRMISEKQADPRTHSDWIFPKDVPESLRIPGLIYAFVHDDHVDLVMSRNPDWSVGARIWSENSQRVHADEPTRYPDVFFYDYTNDRPETPDNIS